MSLKVTQHSCADSRLKCIDCGAQVCPKCATECPVGNRCAQCNKGSTPARRSPTTFDLKKGSGFFLFGGLYGWLISYATFSGLSICFCIALWVAGRESGAQLRNGNKDLTISWMLPFVVGMVSGTVVLFVVSQEITAFILMLVNLGVIGLGFVMGKAGFGCR